ncbi:VTC domain-containing protein [Brachybacterium sp. AOP43-C2-M15]|uniref:VTC domain-containing protein n=1 Tax=Brachybacterium sp. AOP43-C2-M15 TaxID=3457661 RepID=UPI004034E2E1
MTSLADLPPIGLEELSARAGLMTRTDRKYLVPLGALGSVLDTLGGRLQVLEIEGRRTFSYASTYYDTPELLAFRGAAGKRRRRFKVRRRDYLDTGASYLEVKTPTGRGESSKTRIPLEAGTGPGPEGPLDPAATDFVRQALHEAGCSAPDEPLLPVLGTRYARTTVLLEDEDARLTIDTELVWTVPGDPSPARAAPLPLTAPPAPAAALPRTAPASALRRLAVVETKAGTRPSAADRLLWALGHRPTRLSKYATGMALTREELPTNRWHRTVRTLHEDLASPVATHAA